jgi:hypothetical protein
MPSHPVNIYQYASESDAHSDTRVSSSLSGALRHNFHNYRKPFRAPKPLKNKLAPKDNPK